MSARIAYPKDLRKWIADLDLCLETGKVSRVDYDLLLEQALSDFEAAITISAKGTKVPIVKAGFARSHVDRCWKQEVASVPLPALPTVRDAKGNVLIAIPG